VKRSLAGLLVLVLTLGVAAGLADGRKATKDERQAMLDGRGSA
jgi:hypothetical protein